MAARQALAGKLSNGLTPGSILDYQADHLGRSKTVGSQLYNNSPWSDVVSVILLSPW